MSGTDQGHLTGLAALERRIAADLERIEAMPRDWMPRRSGPEGAPLYDVVIIGAGLSGLSIGFGLKRLSVDNVLIIDQSAEGREGPWITCARMDTLRSPKQLTGPDLGLPSMTYRSWYEAIHGEAAWEAVGKIDRADWMDYLRWYRAITALNVRNSTMLKGVTPHGDILALDVEGASGAERLYARKIVLATGIEGAGGLSVPKFVSEGLPRDRWTHSGEEIDAERFVGREIGIVGAAASAFDWAVASLRGGAASATLFARSSEFPKTEVLAWTNFPGFLGHFADLDALRRWRFMRRVFDLKTPPTNEMYQAAHAYPNFRVELGCPPLSATMNGDRVRLDTPRGAFEFDHLLLGTGYQIDLGLRPELAAFVDQIALWEDRFSPPEGEEDPGLGRYPFLGPNFEFTEKMPGMAPWLANIHVFNNGAVPSLGPICNGITGLKYGVPRMVAALTRGLFLADADTHYADLMAYDEEHFRPEDRGTR
ncbi:NAD(P)/FAD-dependent oxidoreductase [Kaistia dalseonensis]|uniref:Cation diffusion facilitator CzcD-associated flavoprotein CzcO n=1 Tax=Kaistia dalseonensis TaxID=410840 RepID=A0ABU0HBZ9_9HYPH|nr:NAD(P)/FAD-dependent oxidoreductase [Kaistia dalseonensis]MCX5497201.1 NAD(P)/FAD-dependent oxidoreductase [Kaistia dalseonensis]MDQ0439832.1 cation diffusion facilitator CzcD-associated flavoprotein CzcO [Kaistia dalseonensis]